MKKQKIKAKEIKVKLFTLIQDAIDNGITLGVNRSFKHTDKPSREYICDMVSNEVMVQICEVIEFSEE